MRQISKFLKMALFFFTSDVGALSQTSTPVDITIDRNGVLLKGKFYISEGTGNFPTVILLQGFPGNETDVLSIGRELSQAGINAITFNYSGTHKSQGQWSFENTQKDIQAVFEFLHQPENISTYKIDNARIYLGGWSFGGGMALTYAANHPEIESIFSISGNDHGEFIREYFRNKELAAFIDAEFEQLKAPTGPIRYAEGALLKETTLESITESVPTIDLKSSATLLAQKDILLIAGWDDQYVTIDNIILPLYRALKKVKVKNIKIVAFQDNHAFRNSRAELAQTIIQWLKTAPERNKS